MTEVEVGPFKAEDGPFTLKTIKYKIRCRLELVTQRLHQFYDGLGHCDQVEKRHTFQQLSKAVPAMPRWWGSEKTHNCKNQNQLYWPSMFAQTRNLTLVELALNVH